MNALDALFEAHKVVPGTRSPAASTVGFESRDVTASSAPETPASEATMHFNPEASGDFDLSLGDPGQRQDEAAVHEAISDFSPESAEPETRPIEPRRESVTVVSDAPALAGLEEFLSAILRARANRSSAAR